MEYSGVNIESSSSSAALKHTYSLNAMVKISERKQMDGTALACVCI